MSSKFPSLGISSFQIKQLAWSFFMALIDGYDITSIAFAAPSLVKEWGLKPGSLGPVFSASLVGIRFGSALFGWVGDRYGRKAALVWSNLVFGVFTLAAAYSTDLTQMFWLRLLARHLLIGPQHYQFSSRVIFATFFYVRGWLLRFYTAMTHNGPCPAHCA